MTPLSVVMVSAGFWPAIGGAERQALELSAALAARGHRVTVLTRRVGGLPARETVRGVTVRRLPAPGGALDAPVFLLGTLAWLLAHWVEWDAVHAHLAGSPALAAALAGRLLGRPALVKLGGGRGIGELAVSSKSALGRAKLRALGFLRPRFLAVVPDLADEAREFLGAAAVEVLPNGVDDARFRPAGAAAKRALRAALGWNADATVFLYAGRFSWEKRLPWFLKLWREAAGERAQMVLVGDGPERGAVEAEAAAAFGRIEVLPSRDDTAGLYAAADVFVLPSVSEGLSNALLEAMSSGLAPLGSRVGGTAETVADGRDGLLFDRDDENALRAAVRRLETEPGLAARLGAAARAAVEERYAMSRVVARLEALYAGGEVKAPLKVLVVAGTRPEAVKLAPVLRRLRREPGRFRVRFCVTGQHRELLDAMLADLELTPDVDLDLMKKGQSPSGVLALVIAGMERVLKRERPGLVLVQGDTTTALGAALAAFHQRAPIGHVEAGLRSFDRNRPFPEESNRIIIDRLSELLFAPTRASRRNLLRESLEAGRIFVTGNTAVDSLAWAAGRPGAFRDARLRALPAAARVVVVTLHRRESFGAPLESVFRGLLRAVKADAGLVLVYPVHPNPAVRSAARRILRHPRILLTGPLGYLDFVRLMKRADAIVTDSGGVQEEAPSLGKPVLVVRERCDRPEVLGGGRGRLVGVSEKSIFAALKGLRRAPARAPRANPVGDGRAADRIAEAILHWAGRRTARPKDFGAKGRRR